jgi:glycyl-tRNA synthetase beta chain
LPPEVIIATVETNQRYFTLYKKDLRERIAGAASGVARYLEPYFITVSNIESKDVRQVISGNERVIRPRLTDALFFWEQDRKQPLAAYGNLLEGMTFQKDIGSYAVKVKRIAVLAESIRSDLDGRAQASALPGTENTQYAYLGDKVRKAAELSKNDLVTRMVYEFPELQGLIGGYYATASESAEVASAIAEHYLPTQSGGPIPVGDVGRIVALADKIDTLAGIFRIGQKPTASKDPFALRRAALGILRICIEGELKLNLRVALQEAWREQPVTKSHGTTIDDAWNFIVERLRSYELSEGANSEQFEAVRSLGVDVPLDFHRRLAALRNFDGTPPAAVLAAADKRARNLLKQAGIAADAKAPVDPHRLEHDAERELFARLEAADAELQPKREAGDYAGMLAELSLLREPVDAFFAAVMVMADDPAVRANRVALLARLDALCREVADLSCLPG